jgi:hypothetical protein
MKSEDFQKLGVPTPEPHAPRLPNATGRLHVALTVSNGRHDWDTYPSRMSTRTPAAGKAGWRGSGASPPPTSRTISAGTANSNAMVPPLRDFPNRAKNLTVRIALARFHADIYAEATSLA